MKFGTKVGHGTLTTGKILVSGCLGNGCHGDEKTFPHFTIDGLTIPPDFINLIRY